MVGQCLGFDEWEISDEVHGSNLITISSQEGNSLDRISLPIGTYDQEREVARGGRLN